MKNNVPFQELKATIPHDTCNSWAQFTNRYSELFSRLQKLPRSQENIDFLYTNWKNRRKK